MSKRIEWVDTLKFLAIWAVYIGHYGVGKVYEFVFLFHIPLFFMISGFWALNHVDNFSVGTYKRFITNNFKQLILPWFYFIVLNVAIEVLLNDLSFYDAAFYFKELLLAIRPTRTWFIPVLFFTMILYRALYYLLHNIYIISISAALYYLLFWYGGGGILERRGTFFHQLFIFVAHLFQYWYDPVGKQKAFRKKAIPI